MDEHQESSAQLGKFPTDCAKDGTKITWIEDSFKKAQQNIAGLNETDVKDMWFKIQYCNHSL